MKAARALAPSRQVTWRRITPRIAADMLAQNGINRPLRKGAVERYAADMLAGRWLPSNDAITVDIDGNLLNGQHRLHAVVLAGIPVEFLVATGYPSESMVAMDSGALRSMANVLHGQGEKDGTALAALARALVLHARGDTIRAARVGPSRGEMLQFIADHPRVREVDLRRARRIGRAIGTGPTVIGVAQYLISGAVPADAEHLDRYLERLETRADEPERSAVHAVARRCRDLPRNEVDRQLLCLIKGWNHWATHTQIRSIEVPAGPRARVLPPIVGYLHAAS